MGVFPRSGPVLDKKKKKKRNEGGEPDARYMCDPGSELRTTTAVRCIGGREKTREMAEIFYLSYGKKERKKKCAYDCGGP